MSAAFPELAGLSATSRGMLFCYQCTAMCTRRNSVIPGLVSSVGDIIVDVKKRVIYLFDLVALESQLIRVSEIVKIFLAGKERLRI